MKRFSLFFLSTLFLVCSCEKNNEEAIGFDPSNSSTFIFQSNYISASRLIIQLNSNRMIDSISYYYNTMNNTPSSIQKFYYSGSNKIDSSTIDGIVYNANRQNVTETYDYDEQGFIKSIYRDVSTSNYFGTKYRKDTLGFDMDSKDRVSKITTTRTSEKGKSISYKEFIYNENDNLTKSIYSSPTDTIIFPNNYENDFEEFDNKINPLYQLSKKCNYPIYISDYWFFATEYSLSKNNLTKMINNGSPETQEITQSYLYNSYSYPSKIESSRINYNIDIFYTNQ